jgi:membrane fusion protein, heavy metal efflux system
VARGGEAAVTRALAGIALLVACGRGHDHGPDDHGHPGEDEAAPVEVTVWTDQTELFAEYPALVVGAESPVAAHLTLLEGFRPLEVGEVAVIVTQADGTVVRSPGVAPLRAGLFRPAITPTAAGACQLRVVVAAPGGTVEEIDAGACHVHADRAAAEAAAVPAPAGRLTYLKEAQWTSPFATTPAAPRDMQDGIRAAGEIRPVAGRHAAVTAPAAGRVLVAREALVPGARVTAGQVLATLAPRLAGADRASLVAEVTAAEAELAAADGALARARRLLAEGAGSARAVEEAQARAEVARARLGGARGRLGQYQAGLAGTGRGSVPVRAPLAGTLVAVEVASGQVVEEGAPLFEVMDLETVWVVARLFEHDLPGFDARAAAPAAGGPVARVRVPGRDDELEIVPPHGGLVTVGRVIDDRTRTVPVIFELADPAGRLRIGQSVEVVIATGPPRSALAIPEAAVLDDAGRPVVFVMVTGESFERRVVRTGVRSGGWIEILAGVDAGERVVSEGAYDVKLAGSGGGIPEHGHAH